MAKTATQKAVKKAVKEAKLGAATVTPVVAPETTKTTDVITPDVDTVVAPVAPKAKKEKTIGGSVILSENKIENRYYISTIDGLSYILSKEEYNEQVS
jgi:hypothetical protein